MLPVTVKRCKILSEFTWEQQHEFFGLKRDKTLHHIDTLYYTVSINEPENVVKLQNEGSLPENLTEFIQTLRDSKQAKRVDPSRTLELSGLEFVQKAYSMYEFCVGLPECFDIFISSYLPNEETPRIVVQLRSRYLVLEGVRKAVEESFKYLKEFLEPFGLFPVSARENRIDYAFHTNLIQNPYKFFSDDMLNKHLKSTMRKFSKYGRIVEDGIELETLNLGDRKSNNVYWRGYNKCQEVIRLNYKSFFFQRWFEHGLISAFDKYVYEVAYELKSYRTGVLVGRLKWYLEHGTNEDLKAQCIEWLHSDYIRSDNNSHLEKKLRNLIPEPTLIFNVEYQTKRRFYTTCAEWLGIHGDAEGIYPVDDRPLPLDPRSAMFTGCDPLLRDLMIILANGREVIDYLTGFGNCVSFVEDRSVSRKKFMEECEPYQAWWQRIRKTPVDYSSAAILELYRKYDLNASFKKSQRLLQGQIARVAMLSRNSTKSQYFVEDMADVLCSLNDNDVQSFVINPAIFVDENGEYREDLTSEQINEVLSDLNPKDYADIRYRKGRQLRGILKNQEKPKPIEQM